MLKKRLFGFIVSFVGIILVFSLVGCPEDDGLVTNVTDVTLNKRSLALTFGETETLVATITPANADNKNVTWSSSNPDVAYVLNGTVIAQTPGAATIYVTTQDGGKTAFCVVTVYDPVHSNVNRFQVIQNIDTGKIKYSYTYNNFDFYYIYLGQMANIPMIYSDNPHYHDGGSSFSFTFTQTDIQSTSISDIISYSNSIATGIAEANTKARDEGGVRGWEFGGSAKLTIKEIFEIGGEVKRNGEKNWNEHESKTITDSFEESRSTTNTVEHATSWARETARSRTFSLSRDNRAGHYRYTMFAISDFYLYVIKDRATSILYYEFKEHVIPGEYSWRLEYTENLPFNKTDDSGFLIDLSILENLPDPSTIFGSFVPPGDSLSAKLSWLRDNAISGVNYIIPVYTNEVINSTNFLSYSGRSDITISLIGVDTRRIIELSRGIIIFSGVTLILDNNITLKGYDNNSGPLVEVMNGGALEMKAGSVITGNTSSRGRAGGVDVSNGSFIMNGGEISNNKTLDYPSGGGVFLNNNSSFVMNDGVISGNFTYGHGGGVYIYHPNAIFTMNGGSIFGNTTNNSGGGVSNHSNFTMNGGSILGNTATSTFDIGGGGIYNTGIFRIQDGIIYGSNEFMSSNRNNALIGFGASLDNQFGGVVQYGRFSGQTWIPAGSLNTRNNTIQVVNGVFRP